MITFVIAIIGWVVAGVMAVIIPIKDTLNISEQLNTLSVGLEYVFWVFDNVNFIIPVDTIFMIIGIMVIISLLNVVKNFTLFIFNTALDALPL